MAKFIGGPLDGQDVWAGVPMVGNSFTAAVEIDFAHDVQRAPYRYVEKNGDWVFESWGKDIIELRPTIVRTDWGYPTPQPESKP